MVDFQDCEALKTELFDFREGEQSLELRQKIYAHLAICAACRDLDAAEQALTGALRPANKVNTAYSHVRGGNNSWLWKAALAAAVLMAVTFNLPWSNEGEVALGSMTRYELVSQSASNGEQEAVQRPTTALNAEQTLTLLEGDFAELELKGCGEVRLTGPAKLNLKHEKGHWDLRLNLGSLKLTVFKRGVIRVATTNAMEFVAPGTHYFSASTVIKVVTKNTQVEPSLGKLRLLATEAFSKTRDYAAAAGYYKKIIAHKEVSEAIKRHSRIMFRACLHNQGHYAAAIKEGEQYLKDYPNDESRHQVLFYVGNSAIRLGEREKAKAYWDKVVKEAPDSEWAKFILRMQGAKKSQRSSKSPKAVHSQRLPFQVPFQVGNQKIGSYLVVALALKDQDSEHQGILEVAQDIAKFHRAPLIRVAKNDYESLARELKQRLPRDVAFVVPKEEMDVNVQREILLRSSQLDSDLFVDFNYGYFYARNAEQLAALWARNKKALNDEKLADLNKKTWINTAVTSSGKSRVLPNLRFSNISKSGVKGKTIYWVTQESDPNAAAFVKENLGLLEEADFITMTGNGDPSGIWLFNGQRNMERDKHWPYEAGKVGFDPKGEMLRIPASAFAKLKLKSPIIWSGTCHSGAAESVFVEGDIVSTFGRVEHATRHRLNPKDSICLSLIDAGAMACFLPIAANHGASCSMERDSAVSRGLSLGATIRATYDDLMMASRGEIKLGIQTEGEKHQRSGYIMQGGGANRILIGDPALKPFKATALDDEHVQVKKLKDGGLLVEVEWQKGYHARAWDIFRNARTEPIGRDRILARVPLDYDFKPGRQYRFEVTFKASDLEGNDLPYQLTHAIGEDFHGERFLHLQANGKRNEVGRKAVRARFEVRIIPLD